jgi:hypothetical protein
LAADGSRFHKSGKSTLRQLKPIAHIEFVSFLQVS